MELRLSIGVEVLLRSRFRGFKLRFEGRVGG